MPKIRTPYPPEFRRQMVDLVHAGRDPDELAKEFEPTAQSIRNWGRYRRQAWGPPAGRSRYIECGGAGRTAQEDVLAKRGRIDVLKVDIETLEQEVTDRIPIAVARHIDRIYVEFKFAANPLEQTHTYRQYGSASQFTNKSFRLA
jgi:transposase-like protein